MTTFEEITPRLETLAIEVPSWAYGNSGTRFKVFGSRGTPRTVQEKIDDAAQVHRFTGLAPAVGISAPRRGSPWSGIGIAGAGATVTCLACERVTPCLRAGPAGSGGIPACGGGRSAVSSGQDAAHPRRRSGPER